MPRRDEIGFFDPNEPIANGAANLPHWRQAGTTYFVTFRLADSLPASTLDLWERERVDWLRRHRPLHSFTQRQEYYERFVVQFHKWLDAGHGRCVLSDAEVRTIVEIAIKHFVDDRYKLREWIVMPNHVHAIVTPIGSEQLSRILQSWKSYTAKQINRVLGQEGPVWQKESFDHIVRSPEQLERIERYIHENARGLPDNAYTLGCIHGKIASPTFEATS